MKIRTVKTIDNGVYIVSITTSDFSCEDTKLISKYGQPTFNAGGVFTTGVHPTVTGSVDLSGGYDFNSVPASFTIAVDGGAVHEIELTANCADVAAIVTHLTTLLGNAGVEVTVTSSSGNIVLTEDHGGASHSMVLGSGVSDALAVFGISAATYNGSGDDDFELPNRTVSVVTDSPFVGRFDSRDYGAEAEVMGDMWAQIIVYRIEEAMADLRLDVDTFSDDTTITY